MGQPTQLHSWSWPEKFSPSLSTLCSRSSTMGRERKRKKAKLKMGREKEDKRNKGSGGGKIMTLVKAGICSDIGTITHIPAYKFLKEEFRICKIYVSELGSSVLYPDIMNSGPQCFGSGSESGSGWIRIQFGPGSGIQIRIRIPDPDSGSRCLKIGLKSQNLL